MVIRDAESERPPACDPATAGASKGRPNAAIGSGHRLLAPRLAMAESPPLTERALAALTDRAASRLAHTLSKYVSPSVGTKCGSRPYSICRTAPDGVVTSWRDQFQQRGEKPALLRPGGRRSPADSAPLPRDGRHRGARATTRAIRARGAVQQCGRDLQPKYPAPSPRAR